MSQQTHITPVQQNLINVEKSIVQRSRKGEELYEGYVKVFGEKTAVNFSNLHMKIFEATCEKHGLDAKTVLEDKE